MDVPQGDKDPEMCTAVLEGDGGDPEDIRGWGGVMEGHLLIL